MGQTSARHFVGRFGIVLSLLLATWGTTPVGSIPAAMADTTAGTLAVTANPNPVTVANNLVTNPSGQQGTAGWAVAFGGADSTLQATTVNGLPALQWTVSQALGHADWIQYVPGVLQEGKTYTFSVQLAGSGKADLTAFDGTQNVSMTQITLTSQFQTQTETVTIPVVTSQLAAPMLQIQTLQTGTANATVDIRNASVTEAASTVLTATYGGLPGTTPITWTTPSGVLSAPGNAASGAEVTAPLNTSVTLSNGALGQTVVQAMYTPPTGSSLASVGGSGTVEFVPLTPSTVTIAANPNPVTVSGSNLLTNSSGADGTTNDWAVPANAGSLTPTTVGGSPALEWSVGPVPAPGTWIQNWPAVQPGKTYTFSVQLAGSGQAYLNVWDGAENVPLGIITLTPQFQTQTETVTIPIGAPVFPSSDAAPMLQVATPGTSSTTVDIRNASVTEAVATTLTASDSSLPGGTPITWTVPGGMLSAPGVTAVANGAGLTAPLGTPVTLWNGAVGTLNVQTAYTPAGNVPGAASGSGAVDFVPPAPTTITVKANPTPVTVSIGNLVTNPSGAGANGTDGWGTAFAPGNALTTTTVDGSPALQWTVTQVPAGSQWAVYKPAVEPGKTYTFSVQVSGSGQAQLGVYNGNSGVDTSPVTLSSTPQTLTQTVTIPAGTPSQAPQLQVVTPPGTATATVDIQNASVTLAEPTTLTAEDISLPASAQVTWRAPGGLLTAPVGNAASDGSFTAPIGTPVTLWNGAVGATNVQASFTPPPGSLLGTASGSAAVDFTPAAPTTITVTATPNPVTLIRGSLLSNPSGANGTLDWVVPGGTTLEPTTVNGSQALQWTVSGVPAPGVWLQNWPTVQQGHTYTFSIQLAGSGKANLNVFDGTRNVPMGQITLTPQFQTQTETVTIPVIPAGTPQTAPPALQVQVLGTGPVSATVDIRDATVTEPASTTLTGTDASVPGTTPITWTTPSGVLSASGYTATNNGAQLTAPLDTAVTLWNGAPGTTVVQAISAPEPGSLLGTASGSGTVQFVEPAPIPPTTLAVTASPNPVTITGGNLVNNPSGVGGTNGWGTAYAQGNALQTTMVNGNPALRWTVSQPLGYSEWAVFKPAVQAGKTYTFSVQLSGSGQAQLGVYNGLSSIDGNVVTLSATPQTLTQTVTIPANAPVLPSGSAPQLQVVTPGTAATTVDIQNATVTQAVATSLTATDSSLPATSLITWTTPSGVLSAPGIAAVNNGVQLTAPLNTAVTLWNGAAGTTAVQADFTPGVGSTLGTASGTGAVTFVSSPVVEALTGTAPTLPNPFGASANFTVKVMQGGTLQWQGAHNTLSIVSANLLTGVNVFHEDVSAVPAISSELPPQAQVLAAYGVAGNGPGVPFTMQVQNAAIGFGAAVDVWQNGRLTPVPATWTKGAVSVDLTGNQSVVIMAAPPLAPQANMRGIIWNAQPYGTLATIGHDPWTGRRTTWVSLISAEQILQKAGVSVTWNGNEWSFGNGVVMHMPFQRIYSPNLGRAVPNVPMWYLMKAMRTLGFAGQWNGQTWSILPPGSQAPSLSPTPTASQTPSTSSTGNLVTNPSGAGTSGTDGWGAAYAQGNALQATTVGGNPALQWTVSQPLGHSEWVVYKPAVAAGKTYTFSVQVSGSGQAQLGVWNGESVVAGNFVTLTSAPQTLTETVTIPAGAPVLPNGSAPQLQVVVAGDSPATVNIQNASVTPVSASQGTGSGSTSQGTGASSQGSGSSSAGQTATGNLVTNPSGAGTSGTDGWGAAYAQGNTLQATTVGGNPVLQWTVSQALGHSEWVVYKPAVAAGKTYTFSVQVSGSGQVQLGVWNGESVVAGNFVTLTSTPQTLTETVTIPAGAPVLPNGSAPQLQVVVAGDSPATVNIQNASVTAAP